MMVEVYGVRVFEGLAKKIKTPLIFFTVGILVGKIVF